MRSDAWKRGQIRGVKLHGNEAKHGGKLHENEAKDGGGCMETRLKTGVNAKNRKIESKWAAAAAPSLGRQMGKILRSDWSVPLLNNRSSTTPNFRAIKPRPRFRDFATTENKGKRGYFRRKNH